MLNSDRAAERRWAELQRRNAPTRGRPAPPRRPEVSLTTFTPERAMFSSKDLDELYRISRERMAEDAVMLEMLAKPQCIRKPKPKPPFDIAAAVAKIKYRDGWTFVQSQGNPQYVVVAQEVHDTYHPERTMPIKIGVYAGENEEQLFHAIICAVARIELHEMREAFVVGGDEHRPFDPHDEWRRLTHGYHYLDRMDQELAVMSGRFPKPKQMKGLAAFVAMGDMTQ